MGPIVAATITAVLLVVTELALGWWAPMPDPYAALRRVPAYVPSAHMPNVDYRIVIEPGLPGVEPVHAHRINTFTTNGLGFRGDAIARPKPANEIRVFTVGGSTMECIALDDSGDLSRLLQDSLDAAHPEAAVRVYNTGKSGDRTYDHLAMVGQRLAHLDPDVVVVFAGINDLMAGLFQVDYLHLEPTTLTRRDALTLLAGESQLYRRARAAARRFRRRSAREIQETIEFETNYAEKAALQRSFGAADGPPRVDLESYATNLRSILAISRAAGARVVLMTQASTWNSAIDPAAKEWHWMRLRLNGTFAEDDMDAALERYNDVMRELAAEEGVELVDLGASLPKSLEFFYDDVHFNDAGAAAAAAAVFAQLETKPLVGSNEPGEPARPADPDQ
jgi:lysophospholipase L1-like esterase